MVAVGTSGGSKLAVTLTVDLFMVMTHVAFVKQPKDKASPAQSLKVEPFCKSFHKGPRGLQNGSCTARAGTTYSGLLRGCPCSGGCLGNGLGSDPCLGRIAHIHVQCTDSLGVTTGETQGVNRNAALASTAP